MHVSMSKEKMENSEKKWGNRSVKPNRLSRDNLGTKIEDPRETSKIFGEMFSWVSAAEHDT